MQHLPTSPKPDWAAACGEHLDPAVIGSLVDLGGEDEPDLIVELIDLFLEDADTRVTALESAARSKDWDQVSRLAHTLKGSSATMGAARFSVACRTVEMEARDGGLARESLDYAVESHLSVQFSLVCLRAQLTESGGGNYQRTA
ncbi:MAG TPA: Hpt domain-containing protein [Planctomycetes bacterium]|nr:Hpt domain-containing protein [Planctomycetota bacterium]HIK62153.1 Hpt domain-containing protein [Planctomycetota bacterium]